ncbi:Hypothetical predicted protein [Pelobates cultripes]|uniref:Reverse transcriptase n=1 Tax=Pelobates cultripes TaxID=61616 RepID=A0AAD1VJZ6_PELCU|nr:Hypothetical predicted protein [Pelobates cultripes]
MPSRPRHVLDDLLHNTQTLIHMWDKMRDKPVVEPQIPLATTQHTIGQMILTFPREQWTGKGIHHVYQVFDRGCLLPFPTIQTKYDLPHRTIFSYLQLKSYVTDKLCSLIDSNNTKHMSKFEEQCVSTSPPKKAMSWGYIELNKRQTHTIDKLKQTWHNKLDQIMADWEWERAFLAHKGLTACASHLKLQRKILYHWYLVPDKLHKLWPTTSNICLRCGG